MAFNWSHLRNSGEFLSGVFLTAVWLPISCEDSVFSNLPFMTILAIKMV